MSRHEGTKARRHEGLALATLVACFVATTAVAQISPSANESISLTGADETPPVAAVETTPPPAEPAPQESRTLGEPNGILSARPVTSDPGPEGTAATDAAPAGSAWWHVLDPRRNEIARVVAALAVVVGLMLLLRTIAQRSGALAGGGRPSGVVEILARYPIARGQRLMLIKLARRVILVHQTGAAMTALAELTDPDEVATLLTRIEAGSRGREASRFKSLLRRHEAEYARPRRATVTPPPMPTRAPADQIVDLTRARRRSLLGPQGKLA